MGLHLTKVAVGCASLDALIARMEGRADRGAVRIVTRFRPTRHRELIGGSLYWIIKHRLVARQGILGFHDGEDRRCLIELEAQPVPVRGIPRRAHQGWRYLPAGDAPADLGGAVAAELPAHLLQELSALALV